MPVFDAAGRVLGLIAVVDSKPMGDIALIEEVLKIFATRATAELERQQAEADLQQSNQILQAISSIQTQFLTDAEPAILFDGMLDRLLELTESEYGFIGEIHLAEDGNPIMDESYMKFRGRPYLKTHAITNIAWNEETRAFYAENAPKGMEFHNLQTLFGAIIVTGEPVIANSPSDNPRRGGLPDGHPPLNAFLGIPFYKNGNMTGMVGIANKAGGYNEKIIHYLRPLLDNCSRVIEAYKSDRQKQQASAKIREQAALLDLTHDAILVRNLDRIITFWNQGASEMYGWTAEEALGQESHQLLNAKFTQHLVAEIAQIINETFPKSIELEINAPKTLWTVNADVNQLHQVLMNLSVNARDAMSDGETLSIKAENHTVDADYAKLHLDAKEGDYLLITVTNTGIGISAEIIDRIFEPFFTTKEIGRGTGLGLSTVIGIIKSHDGFVEVTSNKNPKTHGTQFKVFLPASDIAASDDNEIDTIPHGNGELILVVDDETAILEVTQATLETYNYKVLTASNGIDAIAIYAKNREEIDLVIMDIMMPTMDGKTAILTLKQIDSDIKIINKITYQQDN